MFKFKLTKEQAINLLITYNTNLVAYNLYENFDLIDDIYRIGKKFISMSDIDVIGKVVDIKHFDKAEPKYSIVVFKILGEVEYKNNSNYCIE